MTTEELDRLAELEAKATKGWVVAESYVGIEKRPFLVRGEEDGIRLWDDQCVTDFEFIAALRNAAPSLIALARWAVKAAATFNTLSNVSHSEQLVVEICEKALAAYSKEMNDEMP